jgi:putative component of membrane protein insertase Oxa1/YidC/SpoIIIJ protein YidD
MLKALAPNTKFKFDSGDFSRAPVSSEDPNAPADFVHIHKQTFMLSDPVLDPTTNQMVCTVRRGNHMNMQRNFIYLPWVTGKVSFVRRSHASMPVLTGPMSGCWLVYCRINGHHAFAHIGTDMGPTSTNSLAAKDAWNRALALRRGGAPVVETIRAFQPNPTTIKTWAALSVHHHFYTINLNMGQMGILSVASVVRTNPMLINL